MDGREKPQEGRGKKKPKKKERKWKRLWRWLLCVIVSFLFLPSPTRFLTRAVPSAARACQTGRGQPHTSPTSTRSPPRGLTFASTAALTPPRRGSASSNPTPPLMTCFLLASYMLYIFEWEAQIHTWKTRARARPLSLLLSLPPSRFCVLPLSRSAVTSLIWLLSDQALRHMKRFVNVDVVGTADL